jgi:hypothetical protein
MAMDATTIDARPVNAASTIDDARAARFNTLSRHMDAHSTIRKQHSGAATDTASSSKKVTMAKANAARGVYCR